MAKIEPAAVMTPARKKQLVLGGAAVALLGAVALGAAWFADSSKVKRPDVQKPVRVALNLPVPGQQLNDKDVWRANEGAKMEALNKEIETIKQSMLAGGGQPPASGGAGIDEVPMPPAPSSRTPDLRAMQPIPRSALPPPLPPPPGRPSTSELGQPMQPVLDQHGQAVPVVKRAFSLEVPDAGAPSVSVATGKDGKADVQDESKSADNFLPAGTFMRVVLLAGLDAPTGGQAQSNPHPMLMRVLNPAQLPNSYLADMKDCVIVANSYGDISSERAYVRTDRMSCIDQSGGAIDVAVKGYVAGEDGKAGMRGRLVSKQGQALANAFLAGIGSGIGQAFKESSSTVSTSPLGSTSTVTDGRELQAGLASGVGSAMSQLSKYYIKLAEQVFPVIEVDGGRVVDVILTRGLSIERK